MDKQRGSDSESNDDLSQDQNVFKTRETNIRPQQMSSDKSLSLVKML